MRPIETIVVLGASLVLLGWGMGWPARRALPRLLALVALIHVVVEGQRLSMWPVCAIALVAAIGSTIRSARTPPKGPRWRRVLRGVAAAVVFLTAIPLPLVWPVMRLPEPGGPFGVGQGWFVVTDSSRRERFAVGGGGVRRFPVKIWYPAAAGTTGPRAPYGDPRELGGAGLPPILF